MIAVFLISTFIALAAAISSAISGGSLLAIIAAFLISGWLSSIALAALMAIRAAVPTADSGDDDRHPVTA